MQYRTMPGSSEKLSVLGFGCMRLASRGKMGILNSIDTEKASEQIKYAIENGVNYLDTAYPYHRGNSESFLGDYVLREGYREKVNIATKLPCFTISKKEKIEEIFTRQMKKLRVDCIDYYLLHSLNGSAWDKMLALDIKGFMDRIRRDGRIRKIGFSFHGTLAAFKRIVDEYNWDFVQIQYNIIDEHFQAGIRGIEYASEHGLGVIIMEPLKGGILAGRIPSAIRTIYDSSNTGWTPAEWAFRWVYDNPAVTMVLSGMNEDRHIQENLRIAADALPGSLSRHEIDVISRVRQKYLELMQVSCTGCGYCLPCPAGINIPGVFRDLNNYHMFGKFEAKLYHMAYSGIMTDDYSPHWASSCIDCGKCEEACPQGIKVRNELLKVRRDLEGPVVKGLAAAGRFFINPSKRKS
ncbi:MAG: aldo/keto reductase [Clostridia bacterium]